MLFDVHSKLAVEFDRHKFNRKFHIIMKLLKKYITTHLFQNIIQFHLYDELVSFLLNFSLSNVLVDSLDSLNFKVSPFVSFVYHILPQNPFLGLLLMFQNSHVFWAGPLTEWILRVCRASSVPCLVYVLFYFVELLRFH